MTQVQAGTSLDEALDIAERLHDQIARNPLCCPDAPAVALTAVWAWPRRLVRNIHLFALAQLGHKRIAWQPKARKSMLVVQDASSRWEWDDGHTALLAGRLEDVPAAFDAVLVPSLGRVGCMGMLGRLRLRPDA